jgi:hypothetical protein
LLRIEWLSLPVSPGFNAGGKAEVRALAYYGFQVLIRLCGFAPEAAVQDEMKRLTFE